MLVFYLMLGAIGLSLYHSYKVIRRGGRTGALVDHMLEARREKLILATSGGVAAIYALAVLALTLLTTFGPVWIVLTPFLYLVGWSLPRLWMR